MSKDSEGEIIFRRYRTDKNGKVLDAYHYGLKAWPIRVSGKKEKSPQQSGR